VEKYIGYDVEEHETEGFMYMVEDADKRISELEGLLREVYDCGGATTELYIRIGKALGLDL